MLRLLGFLAVAMAFAQTLPSARAADPFADLDSRRWYVSGIVGGSFMTLTSGGENTLAPAANTGSAAGGAFTGGGALGLATPAGSGQWRTEIEGRQRARLAGQTDFVGDPFLYDVQAADGWSVTANLWRDIAINEQTDFYVGGGIGGGGYRLSVDDQIYASGYDRVAAGTRLESNAITSTALVGIYLQNATGIAVGRAGAGNVITGGTARGLYSTGIYVAGISTGSRVQANTVSGNGSGVMLVGARGVLVGGTADADRNTITGNRGYGLFATGNSTGTTVQRNVITGNGRNVFTARASRLK